MMTNTHLVVMGVAGSGKSTVAQALHRRLGWPLAEGDDFHPPENIAKMSSGQPLTDDDRWPWLDLIVAWTADEDAQGKSTIVTCSALRRIYRERLSAAPGRTLFLHLTGTQELLGERMSARTDHFMPPTLLPSQFATLEPLEADEFGVDVNVDADTSDIVHEAVVRLNLLPNPR